MATCGKVYYLFVFIIIMKRLVKMIENGNYDRIDINLFSAYHLQKKNKSFDRDQFCGASTIGKKGNNMI